MLGDGCAYHWHNQFQVWLVGEEEFTLKFAEELSACLGRQVRHYKYGSKQPWFVRIDNAELFFLFLSVRRDHSLMRTLVQEVDPEGGWTHFIEGFFDAEGCVKVIKGRERKTPKVCLDFCNTDLDLLRMVRCAMARSLGVKSRMSTQRESPPRKKSYHLRVYAKADVVRFIMAIATTKLTREKRQFFDNWIKKGQGKRSLRDFPKSGVSF